MTKAKKGVIIIKLSDESTTDKPAGAAREGFGKTEKNITKKFKRNFEKGLDKIE
ncbi:MAG: hypothetical protein KBA55_03475 [Ruminococcus sp.]|nr:hypothetical protein [Ruminococcus sp.]